MNTVFQPPDSIAGLSGDLMSSSPKSVNDQILAAGAAANADQLGEAAAIRAKEIATTGGWDAYDVWRRFIKEARARRQQSEPN
jgi:hypothetical protein